MNQLLAALPGLFAIATIMFVIWFFSIARRNVSIVDMFWGIVIATAAWVYWLPLQEVSLRAQLALAAVTIWALRLFWHLFRRSSDGREDRRYAAMRARNEPAFWLKSLYLVFGLQALIAWTISWPLYAAVNSSAPLTLLDVLGAVLFGAGLLIETIADWQLDRFRAASNSHSRVLREGLWRYSRHPNYFGECCVWWGIWLLAAAAGAYWTVISPLLMTILLLRVSGVAMLEQEIAERRPEYIDYIATTSAFVPWRPRRQ